MKSFPRFTKLFLSLLLLASILSPAPAPIVQAAAAAHFYRFPVIYNAGQPAWLGPSGGSVVGLVVDPTNPQVYYAGSWGAGMFKSTDGGVTWHAGSQGLGNLYINSLAIDPKRPNILYAGTYGLGVYKSTDSGQTWQAASAGILPRTIVYTLAVNNGNPDIVYAGTRQQQTVFATPYVGILYKSADAGATWNPVLTNVGGAGVQDWVYSVAVDPGKPQVVFAATHEHGPYKSTDYGSTWTVSGSASDGSGRALAVDPRPAQSNLAYYAVWHLSGVFRTTDTGASWSLTSNGLTAAKIYPNGVVIAPSAPDTVYMADFNDNGVWKSTDKGLTWKKAGLAFDRIYILAVSPQNAGVVLAGTLGDGVYQTTNGGANWTRTTAGITNTQVAGVAFPAGNKAYVAATGGMFQSPDKGSTWTTFNTGLGNLNLLGLVQHPANPSILFALTENGVYRTDVSKAGGWSNVTSPSFGASGQIHARPAGPAYPLQDPLNRAEPGDRMLAEDAASASLPNAVHLVANVPVYSLVFAPSSSNIAYAGTDGSGVFASSDGGLTWKAAGLGGASVRSLAVSPQDPKILYAATTTVGVIKFSTNGGSTWSDINLPGLTINTVLVSPARPDVLVAGTSDGVWQYKAVWGRTGLVGSVITRLAVTSAAPGLLYAGSTTGAFVTDDTGLTWTAIAPAELALSTIQSINFDPADSHHIYFGTTTQGLLRVWLP